MSLRPEPSRLSRVFTTIADIYRNASLSRFQRVQEQFDALPDQFRDKILNIISSLNGTSQEPFGGSSTGLDQSLLIDASSLPHLQTAIQRAACTSFAKINGTPTGYLGVETMLHLLADHSRNQLSPLEIATILERWVEEAREEWVEEYLFSSFDWTVGSGYQCMSSRAPRLFIREPQWEAEREISCRITASETIMYFVNTPIALSVNLRIGSSVPPVFHADMFTSRLRQLDLSESDLEFLPSEIFRLKNLEGLDLSNTRLISLPPEIGRLTALRALELGDNESLTGIPMQILDLPSSCWIDLEGTGLSHEVLERLREIVTAEGYHGPRISYSMGNSRTEERPMGELLKELFALSEETEREFPNLLSSEQKKLQSLQSWLSRLSDTADYQKEGERQAALAKKVLGYMQLAETNPKFRDKFFMNIDGASRTCGDRVALSILHIGMSYKLLTMNKRNTKEIADFLIHTVWPVDMLEEIARNKIPALPFFDEIEVYLTYPIKLRERLGLKIDVEDMLYFTCSALNDSDFDEAEAFVKKKQADEKAALGFLSVNEEWEEVLIARYPTEMQKIKREADAETEAAVENCAPDEVYVSIQERRLAKLMNLSARSLQ